MTSGAKAQTGSSSSGSSGITALTGDVTASGTGSVAATLVGTTNVDSVINTAVSTVGVTDVLVTGLTGATTATRYVGGTTNGAPTTGTFQAGDFVIDQTATIWVYTGATAGWSTTISCHVKNRTASATVSRNEITQFTGSTGQTFTAPSNPIDGSSWTFLNNTANSVTLSFTPSMYPLGSASSVSTFTVPGYGVFNFVNYNGSNWYMVQSNSLTNMVGVLPVANGGSLLNSASGSLSPSYYVANAYAQTIDPNIAAVIAGSASGTPTYSITKGYLYANAVYLQAGQVVSKLSMYVSTAGSSSTCYLGLYNATTQLGATASFSTNSTGFFTQSLTSAYTVPTTGVYFVVLLCSNSSTTPPTIYSNAFLGAQGTISGFGPAATLGNWTAISSQISGTATTLPATVPSSTPTTAVTFWHAVS